MAIRCDERGSSAVEFALLAPVFILLIFGLIDMGAMLWTEFGLQHGVEMAARCASVNQTACGSTANIQAFAADQTYGVNPPSSTFAVTTQACGYQVSASYKFELVTLFGLPAPTLSAQSCFPKAS